MKTIFNRASRVFARLGPAMPGASNVIPTPRKIGTEAAELKVEAVHPLLSFKHKPIWKKISIGNTTIWKKANIGSDVLANIPLFATEHFFRRPYWRRSWIMQEIAVAQKLDSA